MGDAAMTLRQGMIVCAMVCAGAVACGKKTPPVARPAPPPPSAPATPARPPAPPAPINEPTIVPPEPVRDDAISPASIDDLNKNSPLTPVFFELDSSDLGPTGQKALDENAALLKRFGTWTVTIEGHCDERGT